MDESAASGWWSSVSMSIRRSGADASGASRSTRTGINRRAALVGILRTARNTVVTIRSLVQSSRCGPIATGDNLERDC